MLLPGGSTRPILKDNLTYLCGHALLTEGQVHGLRCTAFGSARDLGKYLYLQGAMGNFDPASDYTNFFHRNEAFEMTMDAPG